MTQEVIFLFTVIYNLLWMISRDLLDSILIKSIFSLIIFSYESWLLYLDGIYCCVSGVSSATLKAFDLRLAFFYSFNFLTITMKLKSYLYDPLQRLFQDWPSLASLYLWDLWSPFLANSFWISFNLCVKSGLLIVVVTLISPLNFQSSTFSIFSQIT